MERHRMLIGEDHDDSRDLLRAIYRRRGWDVQAVGTVEEGLACLVRTTNCVILDLDLPDGGGEAVLSKVRDAHLPARVAVCSGSADVDRLERIRGLGPAALLRKPIDFDLMEAAIGA